MKKCGQEAGWQVKWLVGCRPMKFEDELLTKLFKFSEKGLAENRERAVQLCKVNRKIELGKVAEGTRRGVSLPLDWMKCPRGKWIGGYHIETVPMMRHSDEDIKNDISWILNDVVKQPFVDCVGNFVLEPAPPDKPEKLIFNISSLEWNVPKKELEKAMEQEKHLYGAPLLGPLIWSWAVRDKLKKKGFVKEERQWVEIPIVEGIPRPEEAEVSHEELSSLEEMKAELKKRYERLLRGA